MSPNATTSAAAARKAKLLENSAKRLQAITNDATLANVDSHNAQSDDSLCAPQTSTLKVSSEGGGSDGTISSLSPQSSLCYLASGSSAAEIVAAPTPKTRCTLQTAHCTLWTVHILHLAIVAAFVIRFDSFNVSMFAPIIGGGCALLATVANLSVYNAFMLALQYHMLYAVVWCIKMKFILF